MTRAVRLDPYGDQQEVEGADGLRLEAVGELGKNRLARTADSRANGVRPLPEGSETSPWAPASGARLDQLGSDRIRVVEPIMKRSPTAPTNVSTVKSSSMHGFYSAEGVPARTGTLGLSHRDADLSHRDPDLSHRDPDLSHRDPNLSHRAPTSRTRTPTSRTGTRSLLLDYRLRRS